MRNRLLLVFLLLLAACSDKKSNEKKDPTTRPTALAGALPTLPNAQPLPTLNIPIAVDDARFPIEPSTEGKVLYDLYCSPCHGLDGQGQAADATGLITAPPHNNSGHTWHHPDQANFATVYTGRHVEGAYNMPRFGGTLTPDQIISILGYIKTWWGEEELATQREITLNFIEERK